LDRIEQGIYTGDATTLQIAGTIIPEMNSLLELVKKKKIPPRKKRWILSTAYVTRGWNWNIRGSAPSDELREKLGWLETHYTRDL
jgi:hypothetical protein